MMNSLLEILYQDPDMVAVFKPTGLITHKKSIKSTEISLIDKVVEIIPKCRAVKRSGLVHRLDKETSGVIVFAKTNQAFEDLKKQFKDRQVRKTYLALVEGQIDSHIKAIDLPLRRSPSHRLRREVSPVGKQAMTEILDSKVTTDASALMIRPITGRTNQIRAHLAHIGHPIFYDNLYGANLKGPRLMLHAYSLEIAKKDKSKVLIIAPIPEDMRNLGSSLKLDLEELISANRSTS